MTNEQLQLIGISEAAFNAATEEQRIEWAKANTTAGFGLCDPAIKYLSSRFREVGEYVPVFQAVTRVGDGPTRDGRVYRLSPDYQPPVKAPSQLPRYVVKSTDGIKYVYDNKGRYTVCQGAHMQDLWRIVKSLNAIEASKIEASKEATQ